MWLTVSGEDGDPFSVSLMAALGQLMFPIMTSVNCWYLDIYSKHTADYITAFW